MNDPIFLAVDIVIIMLVGYVIHVLRCIERNTRHPRSKDLFQK